MGSPLTVALAEVRVSEIESLALSSSADPPSLYKHFVDDGISRYRDAQHAEIFLQHLNSQSNDLVYTAEHPRSNDSLLFLDILLHSDLSTSVYRKPTHTDSYTHYSTSAPQSTKDSLIRSLTRRAYDVCSPQHLQNELQHIRKILLDNGYPRNHIEQSSPSNAQPRSPINMTNTAPKSSFLTTRMSTSKSKTYFIVIQFPQFARPTKVFAIFLLAPSLVNQ